MDFKDYNAIVDLLGPVDYPQLEDLIRQKVRQESDGQFDETTIRQEIHKQSVTPLLIRIGELERKLAEAEKKLESRTSDLENLLTEWEAKEEETFIPPLVRVPDSKIENLVRAAFGKTLKPEPEGPQLLKERTEECLRRAPNCWFKVSDIIGYLERNGFPVKADFWQKKNPASTTTVIYRSIYNNLCHLASKKWVAKEMRKEGKKSIIYWRWIKEKLNE